MQKMMVLWPQIDKTMLKKSHRKQKPRTCTANTMTPSTLGNTNQRV